jgi:CO/xanthine dehydrogenase Mo-binding subunit
VSEPRKFRYVGTRPIRHDGLDKVTGRAQFGADLLLPGMLYGKVLRSPYAHARIRRIDPKPALEVEGVHAVITSADLPEIRSEHGTGGEGGPVDFRDLSRNVLARDKVLYHGHPVAAVAATSPHIAEEALKRIEVDYEILAPVLDVEAAMAPDAPLLHDDLYTKGVDPRPETPSNVATRLLIERGDIEKGFAEADVVVEREYRTETVHQGYIEPHAAVASVGEDGQSVVWCCTQGSFLVRSFCAKVLGLSTAQIKVIPSEVGGAFGGKTTVYVEPLAILLSRRAGRPVKLVMDREEVFRASGPGSASVIRVKMAARKDGRITATKVWLAYAAGAFPGSPMLPGAMTMLAPYELENVRIEGYDVVVNKPKTNAYRAPGSPMAAFAAESALDEIAQELGVDPIELRLRNAVRTGSQAVYGPTFREIGYVETLEAARSHPHYRAPLGPNQGRGVASGFWFNAGMQSTAAVNVNEDGSAIVVTGSPDLSGTRVSLALMAAEELGIPVERIRPIVTDTEAIGYNDVTGGSRVTFATGMAVIEAAREVVRQLCERAALLWEVPAEQVEWREGAAHSREAEARDPLTLEEIVRQAARTGGPISGQASLTARGAGPGFGTHICDVSVDPDTGRVQVVRYTAVQDVGKAVHPTYVEGQLQGGVAQGIGWALNEEYVYDDNGVLQNAGFLDYRIPVASDLPMIDTVLVEVPNPSHPHGVRGVGEVPIVPPLAAVANAVFRATGVRFYRLPMSPPRVLEGLQSRE